MIINIVAILYGGLMTINFALWKDSTLFGNFGSALRDASNPSLKLVTSGGQPISWLQAGTHFGEMALFNNRPRSATIVLRSPWPSSAGNLSRISL